VLPGRALQNWKSLQRAALVCALLVCGSPARVQAGDMDPELTRLSQSCGADAVASMCPDNASFELLAMELAGALAPTVRSGAATGGERSFYVGLSSAVSSIRGQQRYWARGTRGADPTAMQNDAVDSLLSFHRLDVRKGLPFGFEVGSSVGFGMNTSLWVVAAELKLALFEGFRSGLGALPDVALRAVTQAVVGSTQLSLQTQALDITLSKPFSMHQEHTLTPLLALQLLFLRAHSSAVDFTPRESAWASCDPSPMLASGALPLCQSTDGARELANTASFRDVSRTRVRMFLGAEERYRLLSIALTLGFDLITPSVPREAAGEGLPETLLRQFSLQLAGGLRY
jgi:hypothetical protein